MFCLHCSTENADDSKFCKECGALVGTPAVALTGRGRRARLSPFIAEELGAADQGNPQLQRLMELALWHSQSNNVPAAILACETALLIDADNVDALSLLGCLYERQGKIDKAISVYERVVVISPESEADREKLNALKRGDYLPPVPQPFGYQWAPPMLVKLLTEHRALSAVVGGIVAVSLFGGGVAAILTHHTGLTAASVSTSSSTAQQQTQDGNIAMRAAPPAPQARTASVTDVAASSHPIPTAEPIASPRAAPSVPQSSRAAPNLPVIAHAPRVAQSAPLAGGNTSVPAITAIRPLSALPTATVASYSSLPDHTVVVAPAGDMSSGSGGAAAQERSGQFAQLAAPASYVHVRVHEDTVVPTVAPSVTTAASVVPVTRPRVNAPAQPSRGAKLQAQALALQQGGDYRVAARTYQSAISEYRAEAGRGELVSEAQRGIETCETGLQLCQASQ